MGAFADAAGVSEKSKRVETKVTPALVVEIQSEQQLPQIEVITPVLEQVSQEEALVHEAQKILEPIEIEVVPILEQTLESSVVVPAVPVVSVAPTTEPQSLITHEDIPEKRSPEKQGVLPSNLPLLPFESSPHIWSFAKYKDVFHKEATVQEEIKVINVMPQEASSFVVKEKVFEEKPYIKIGEDVEVVMETIPLRKDDKPLVFLATIMLLAIIVILGYMYSNGRL